MALTNPQTEPQHALAVLVSEAPGMRSREAGIVLAGSSAVRTLTSGMVLGKRLIGATCLLAVAHAGNTGAGVFSSSPDVTVTGPAKRGVYRLKLLSAGATGVFIVFDPDGIEIGKGAVGSAFAKGGLSFTLADGSPDFAVGDGFDLEISGGTDKWLAVDAAGTLGEQNAEGILLSPETITAPDGSDISGAAVLVRDAEVNKNELVWPSGASADAKEDWLLQLNRLGIFERPAV